MARAAVNVDDLLRGTPYRALSVLGRGGMGLVVEAERIDLGRRVAVKVLHREIAADRGIVDRLRIEAQTLGRITSPHVVQVLDLGRTGDGRPYLAMERLAGTTLRDRIKGDRDRPGGPLDAELALEIADQLLRGLGEAHAIGIVHRDVKPENVFLAEERGGGVLVKVLDFGVAKVLRGGGDIAPPVVPTEEGTTVGTPRYLAPEQVLGSARIDHRADLYAVGLVLWAMLVGRVPFDDSSDAVELARRQIQGVGVPPPSSIVSGLPRALDALVARATAKSRDDRYPDAEAFRRAIDVARAAVREARRPPAPKRQLVTFAMETVDPATLGDPSTLGDPATLGDLATLAESTIEAPPDPSTVDAPTRDQPPELPTVALPEGMPGHAAPVDPTMGATRAPQTLRSASATPPRTLAMEIPPAPPMSGSPMQPGFPSSMHGVPGQSMAAQAMTGPAKTAQPMMGPALLTPTPPAVAVASAGATHGDGGWRTFLLVVAVTVVVLGAAAGALLVLGGGEATAGEAAPALEGGSP